MKNCYLCESEQVREILNFEAQPVCHRFLDSPTEFEYTHSIVIGQCHACGLVQLTNPMPAHELRPRYDWLTCTEPEAHLDQLAQTISHLPGIAKDAKIVGISFKEDSILERLNRLGFQDTWRLDPVNELGINAPLANVETIQEAFTPLKAKAIATNRGKADIVIARHLIEHAFNLRSFIESAKALVKPEGYIIFEIPDCQRAFENFDYTNVWEEHVIYFTPETFRSCFGFGGLKLVYFEKAPYPLEDSYIGIAQPQEITQFPFPKDEVLKAEIKRVEWFAQNLDNQRERFKKFLRNYRQTQGKIALFGAAHMSCTFINLLELKDCIEFVVDDNPHKAGMFMPGSRLPILKSTALLEEDIKLCLLTLSPASEEKVVQNNQEFQASGGRFVSIFPGNPRALNV